MSSLVWAFVPFKLQGGFLEGFDFDTLQSKRELARAFQQLRLPWIWQPIVQTNLERVLLQVAQSDSVVLNLCDGIEDAGTPGICVVRALEHAGIRYTGADPRFYQTSTSKLAMKKLFMEAGVPTPPFEALPPTGPVAGLCSRVGVPLLVKPDVSAASAGVFSRSKVATDEEASAVRDELLTIAMPAFCDPSVAFAEKFIEGPEFTVLVLGRGDNIRCLPAAERVFNASVPDSEKFLSYEHYWGFHHDDFPDGLPFYSYAACPADLADSLEAISKRAYQAVGGTGYARVDLRMDRASGELFVLEVNANCGLSEDDQTSTGCILKLAGLILADLLRMILLDAGAAL